MPTNRPTQDMLYTTYNSTGIAMPSFSPWSIPSGSNGSHFSLASYGDDIKDRLNEMGDLYSTLEIAKNYFKFTKTVVPRSDIEIIYKYPKEGAVLYCFSTNIEEILADFPNKNHLIKLGYMVYDGFKNETSIAANAIVFINTIEGISDISANYNVYPETVTSDGLFQKIVLNENRQCADNEPRFGFYRKSIFERSGIYIEFVLNGISQNAYTPLPLGEPSLCGTFFSSYEQLARQVATHIMDNQIRYNVDGRKPNNSNKKYRTKKQGSYITHNVPFSCEVECYGKSKKEVAELSKLLPKSFGLCRDGSLTSTIGFPIEIQTPILEGKKGEVAIAELLCGNLVNLGFMVDKTCGMHIHLDGKDILGASRKERPDKLIALYLFYRMFDDVIVSFLPSTRRYNEYCASFKDGVNHNGNSMVAHALPEAIKRTEKIKSLNEFELFWYNVRDSDGVEYQKRQRYTVSRYFGINFHSLLKDNHIEVRYHSGTINYEKILYWIDLHGNILQACLEQSITEEMLKSLNIESMTIEQKTNTMMSMLNLNKDTIEYLYDRQARFANVVESEEILIDKTKKMSCV